MLSEFGLSQNQSPVTPRSEAARTSPKDQHPVFLKDTKPDTATRCILSLMALGILSVFVLATFLEPDPRGLGTHEQLGLPPCSFLQWTGHRCPHCGMTTSFSWLVRGQLSRAWTCNPCGPLLALGMVVWASWSAVVAVMGRWLWTSQPFQYSLLVMLIYLVLALVFWGVREPGL